MVAIAFANVSDESQAGLTVLCGLDAFLSFRYRLRRVKQASGVIRHAEGLGFNQKLNFCLPVVKFCY